MVEARKYLWDDPYLYKVYGDNLVRRCVLYEEVSFILKHCHCIEAGSHLGFARTFHKVLQSGYYWPTLHRDAHAFVRSCDNCQCTGALSGRLEMP